MGALFGEGAPSQSRIRSTAPPRGEPTHLQGKRELWAGFWAVNAAEGRAAIGSPFGRAGKAVRL